MATGLAKRVPPRSGGGVRAPREPGNGRRLSRDGAPKPTIAAYRQAKRQAAAAEAGVSVRAYSFARVTSKLTIGFVAALIAFPWSEISDPDVRSQVSLAALAVIAVFGSVSMILRGHEYSELANI